MAGAIYAAVVYAMSSLSIVFANKFIMQVLFDPFALLLGQVVVTLAFSLIALFFSVRNDCKFMLDNFNRHVKWFALIGFSSFVGWSASLEGLKSGSVATLTMIKGANPLLAALLANFLLPPSQQNRNNGHLGWVAFAAVGCCFYTYDSASADIRACLFFLMSVLSASVNAVSFKLMQVHSPLPCDTLLSVLYSSVLINAAALPFVLVAFLDTVSSDTIVQIATLMCTPLALFSSTLSLCSSVAISISGFWAQKYLSATTYIVFINSCKIPAIVISVLIGQDGCIDCDFFRSIGILIWSVGSFRYLYVTIEVGEGLSSDAIRQVLSFRGKSKSFPTKYAKFVLSVLLIITPLYMISSSNTLSRKYDGTTGERHNPLHFINSTRPGLYESVAGPDPRILTGLPVGGRLKHRISCSGPIQFEPSDVTHSLFDAAVKVSPGFQFVLGISNSTLKSWRDCSVKALEKARSYYAQVGGGILPDNIYTRPYDSCRVLHKAVAPIILAAIQSITKILRFFGHNSLIKQQYCYEAAGRPHVNPSEKLVEWRTFMKRHDNARAVAPGIYTSGKRGYVFSGSSTQNLLMARSIVDVMRSHGSVLPAEFWIDPVDADTSHISPDECRLAFVLSGLQCRYMCEISEVQLYFPLCHPNWRYSPYQSKLIAIKYSSFEQVFFLDNDIVPLKSMDYMFSTAQFIQYGAIFWAEFLPEQPHFPWVPDVAEAIGVNWSFPLPDQLKHFVSPLCSAQIMIDKGRFWQELSLATYLNLDTTFFYRVMHGDKDIFAAAWMVSPIIKSCARLCCYEFEQLPEPSPQALGSRWYLIQASGVIGYACKMREGGMCDASLQFNGSDTRVCGTEWLRYDTEGQPLLAHHAKDMNTMTTFSSGKVDASWQVIVEHTNTVNPVAAGIAGGGFRTSMKIADGTNQRSLSSGGYCLELGAKNVVVRQTSPSMRNSQWLFYQVVNRNMGRPLAMPLDSIVCSHATAKAGLVQLDKEKQFLHFSGIPASDVRPKFLGKQVPCLCMFLVGKISDPKTLCLDHPLRKGCVVYDLGVQHERRFASSMRLLGCEVHSYDPTMQGVTPTEWFQATGGAVFHDVGVAGFNGVVQGIGKVQTVASMMEENAHKVIDYLKIDVESFEWDALFHMHSSGVLERIGTIQIEVHFWNKACFAHWVEWETIWGPRGYPSESSSSRACTNENAKGSAASNEDIAIWQKAFDILMDSGFHQVSLEVVGGGQLVEFPNGEVLPCCFEINLVRPNWNGVVS